LRVLLVIDHFGPGGAQRQLAELATGLAARRHEVHCFVYHASDCGHVDRLRSAGVQLHRHHRSGRYSLGVIWALRTAVLSVRPDVVLSFMRTPTLYALLATRGSGCPLIAAERSSDVTAPRLLERVTLFGYRWIRKVVTNSRAQRDLLIATGRINAASIVTIWNGVDLDRFRPGLAPVKRVDDPPRLLAIGRVGPEKNSEALARALAICHAKGDVVPTVTWAGPPDETPAGQRTRKATDDILCRAGLTGSWRWLGWQPDVAPLLQNHDALIHPALFEGLPNAVCEALAAGRPVLAGAVADAPRLVQDGITGILFDPLDAESIASAIRRFLRIGCDGRLTMGAAARAFAEEHLSMSRCVSDYEHLLLEMARPLAVR
jgi:glycosyltransferase involved in cell wall biosynthesis